MLSLCLRLTYHLLASVFFLSITNNNNNNNICSCIVAIGLLQSCDMHHNICYRRYSLLRLIYPFSSLPVDLSLLATLSLNRQSPSSSQQSLSYITPF
jgi:hypothetical protein